MVITGENPNLNKPKNSQGGLEMGDQALPSAVNKRGLSELSSLDATIYEEKQAGRGRRPITRKFAQQMANTQPPRPQETKRAKPAASNSNGFGDLIYIDEEHKLPKAMPCETEEEEDEMDDIIVEEPVKDIDSCDAKNPLAVVDYTGDLYAHYRETETFSCASPNYMVQQFDINERMRSKLLDWLVKVHDKFEHTRETLFLTINLIDRFLSQQALVREKLQLVGMVAMLLACKYEGIPIPAIEHLILLSNKVYTRKEVLEMEISMLNTLQFNVSVPTPYVFIQRFLKAAQSDEKLEQLAFFLIELSLVEYEMLKFSPSLLAATAVYTAQCTLYGFKQWSKTCEWYTSYSEEQLLECTRLMVGLHQKAATGEFTAVHEKYCTSKFGFTATREPAHFLLDCT